ncbi:uncharacterized protein [Canis lupus baileyi]|uniref:uncharacterized protein n=1 Tax=Canis lupus baileyi TaxID=143281 RepID=UPI003B97822E
MAEVKYKSHQQKEGAKKDKVSRSTQETTHIHLIDLRAHGHPENSTQPRCALRSFAGTTPTGAVTRITAGGWTVPRPQAHAPSVFAAPQDAAPTARNHRAKSGRKPNSTLRGPGRIRSGVKQQRARKRRRGETRLSELPCEAPKGGPGRHPPAGPPLPPLRAGPGRAAAPAARVREGPTPQDRASRETHLGVPRCHSPVGPQLRRLQAPRPLPARPTSLLPSPALPPASTAVGGAPASSFRPHNLLCAVGGLAASPGIYPRDVISIHYHQLGQPKMSPAIAKCPWKKNCSPPPTLWRTAACGTMILQSDPQTLEGCQDLYKVFSC